MADVQDEEQWLYGDDKEVSSDAPDKDTEVLSTDFHPAIVKRDPSLSPERDVEENADQENKENESQDKDQESAKDKEEGSDEDSSSEDEPTVTIGKIVKQPDIVRPLPAHRAAPTSGLKPEDFVTPGKINGVPATDFNLGELEEKPWRKPGADLSDYFNYGFTEETWIKYCERQKSIRVHESEVGLATLGINFGKMAAVPSVINENSKYISGKEMNGSEGVGGNTIQVMTADRRIYSQKQMNLPQAFDNMDFGVHIGQDFFNVPPPVHTFTAPPPPTAATWVPPPGVPPPVWRPPESTIDIPPPIHPPVAAPPAGYYDKEMAARDAMLREMRDSTSRERERERDSRRDSMDRDRERSDRDSRRHRRRSRSRSRSRMRRRSWSRSRSRSRSRSPHKHKRKKSKRD